jgi:hypothetical protein
MNCTTSQKGKSLTMEKCAKTSGTTLILITRSSCRDWSPHCIEDLAIEDYNHHYLLK